jgi:uncharacterized protein with HEPN domain
MAQDAMIRKIKIIGEASHQVEKRYPEFETTHAELPFAFAYVLCSSK